MNSKQEQFLSNLNLSSLFAFIDLSYTLNFTKSADNLHTSQPNLSKIIDKLERDLGVSLLTRDTRKVALTEAGLQLREDIIPILNDLYGVFERAKLIDKQSRQQVNIAVLGTAVMGKLPLAIKNFYRKYEDVKININDYDMSSLNKCLVDPHFDLVFAPEILTKSIQTKNKFHFYSEPLCLVTHLDDPLTLEESISLSSPEIESLDLVMPSSETMPIDYDFIVHLLDPLNINYRIRHEANSLISLAMMVEVGKGVSFLSEHMAHYYKNLAFVKVEEFLHSFNIYCVWKNETNPQVMDFVSCVRDIA